MDRTTKDRLDDEWVVTLGYRAGQHLHGKARRAALLEQPPPPRGGSSVTRPERSSCPCCRDRKD